MAYTGPASGLATDLAGYRTEGREPGARRRKLAGYLKAANEIRQSYFQGEHEGGGRGVDDDEDSAFPDAAVVRHGNEEMVLFPSYARKHRKIKPAHPPEEDGNDSDYWKRQFEKHESDNAVVDVDVRGWLYTPHKGPTTRKQRLMIGLARQLSGVPAVPATKSNDSSTLPSRTSSPTRHQEEDLIAFEAEKIVQRGNAEAEAARRGAFSEPQQRDSDADSLFDAPSWNPSVDRGRTGDRLSQISNTSSDEAGAITPLQKRSSWQQPSKMSNAELAVANAHLLTRLKPFMANPLADSAVSAFFYNDQMSRQRTVFTDPSGHFSCRASLDFVPTHVRVLGGEKLSATEEVNVTDEKGVSLISDIDDTIKHSAISAGAREIFRNAFIRDLGDLTIEGVREWYTTLHDMGVKMHYVSNSPWQMYPILTSYFKMAQLPRGSFHLKQYTGMLQGIFEPVAERKKSSLDKIMRDFPERKFILVGDSGEADLEVYTEVVLDNPGRVLGVFIRDVTTPPKTGYFDQSGSGSQTKPRGSRNRGQSGDSLAVSKRLSRPQDTRQDDAELQAAIAASLESMEEETRLARQHINPDSPQRSTFPGQDRTGRPPLPARSIVTTPAPYARHTASPEEDLIDFSDEPTQSQPWLRHSTSEKDLTTASGRDLRKASLSPSPPAKPLSLRRPSTNDATAATTANPSAANKAPPPRPRKPSSSVKPPSPQPATANTQPPRPSPLSQVTRQESFKARPPLPARPKTVRNAAMDKLSSVYNSLPTPGIPASLRSAEPTSAAGQARPMSSLRAMSNIGDQRTNQSSSGPGLERKAPAPPPPRRIASTSTFSTVTNRSKSINRLSGAWSDDGTNGAGGTGGGDPNEAGMSRKEIMWQQRLARARDVMEPQGVTLRTWRVGSDVADVCVRLAEMSMRDIEKEERKKQQASDRS